MMHALLREAAACRHGSGARARGRAGRSDRRRTVDLDAVRRVHDAGYVDFLSTAWEEWTAQGRTNDALPLVWPVPAVRHDRVPHTSTASSATTRWTPACRSPPARGRRSRAGAAVALDRRPGQLADGAASAFALCRPPGHHAGAATMGGYCYLNNAAIAAQYLLRPRLRPRGGARRGLPPRQRHAEHLLRRGATCCSCRSTPTRGTSIRTSSATPTRRAPGAGARLHPQLPAAARHRVGHLRPGAGRRLRQDRRLRPRCGGGLARRRHLRARSDLALPAHQSTTIPRLGARIAAIGRPTLFVMEGGYAVDDIGVNAVNVLSGFEGV